MSHRNNIRRFMGSAIAMLLITQTIFVLSCQEDKTSGSAQKKTYTLDQLYTSIGTAYNDSTTKVFSSEMIDTIEMFFDKALLYIRDKYKSEDFIVSIKVPSMVVANLLTTKFGDCDQDRMMTLLDKSLRIMHEFTIEKDDRKQDVVMGVTNVFLPEHRDSVVPEYFDVYIRLEKPYYRCISFDITLPLMYSDENVRPKVNVFLKENILSEQSHFLDVTAPFYSNELGRWYVKLRASDFDEILKYDNLYVSMTTNGKEEVEIPMIYLKYLREQYAELSGKMTDGCGPIYKR